MNKRDAKQQALYACAATIRVAVDNGELRDLYENELDEQDIDRLLTAAGEVADELSRRADRFDR